MSDRKDLSRREFLKLAGLGVGGLVLAACRIKNTETPLPTRLTSIPTVLPPEDESQKYLERMHREVERLAETYQEGSLVRTVYAASDLRSINPAFKYQTSVGVADPKVTFARTYFTDFEWSEKPRFQYYLNSDSSLADYQTLDGVHLRIFFSPTWLEGKSEEVKKIALEKEAYIVAQWNGFSRIALNTYQAQGQIRPVDPLLTQQEAANTLVVTTFRNNPDLLKLYDYAPYLLFLDRVGKIIDDGDIGVIKELNATNLQKVYKMAKDAGVPFAGLQFDSPEYFKLAFGGDSPWVELILDPSLPSPENIK